MEKLRIAVALTRIFWPNIKRIKSKVVCVLTAFEEVAKGLELAQGNFRGNSRGVGEGRG